MTQQDTTEPSDWIEELLLKYGDSCVDEMGVQDGVINQSDFQEYTLEEAKATITAKLREARMDGARTVMRTVAERFKNAGITQSTPDELDEYITAQLKAEGEKL